LALALTKGLGRVPCLELSPAS